MMNGAKLWLCGDTALTNKSLIRIVFLALGLSACSTQTFPIAQCDRVNITHKGKPVIGVEDMAYDDITQTLYLSAYDRRRHSKGGIYRLPVETATSGESLTVTSVIDGIRSHGIDLTRTNHQLTPKYDDVILSFIDRQGDRDEHKPAIRTLSWNDETPDVLTEEPPFNEVDICAANDLARTQYWDNNGGIFVTQDHKSCTRKAQARENIFASNNASVGIVGVASGYRPYLEGLSFANGIVMQADKNRLYVAETRKKRVTLYSKNISEGASIINLTGAPDNLTRNGDDVYAALIPNLIRFSRFQKRETKRIKSRFAIITSTDGVKHSVTTYDVPASIISGATAVIKAGEHIWLGGAYDTAIARCTLPNDPS